MTTNYDELNIIPIEKYFKDMQLSDEQIEAREKLAEDMDEVLDYIFLLMADADLFQIDRLKTEVFGAWIEMLADKYEVNEDTVSYARDFAKDFVEQTIKDISNPTILSDNRKTLIAENESNSVNNMNEFKIAIKNGKTKKTWNTILDGKERAEHFLVDGKTIPINDYFDFSDCKMLYPHDSVNGSVRQLANCRCSLSFI